MMASGTLRLDDPGEHAVLARCDRVLTTVVTDLVNHPQDPIRSYNVRQPRSAAAIPGSTITNTRPKNGAGKQAQINRAVKRQTGERSSNSSFQARWLDISTRLSLSDKIAGR